ncbi:urate hydroxylase PuuD [Faunimonas sp. B44]|uniref:urate hydroxylase PuuD n=1 Tax=Faunimonas sp. B44 TaxID=3461493 RepID=UPI004043AABA
MTAILIEWLNLVFRWAHVMAGIAWIGTSFHFIWLDQSLKKRAGQPDGIAGESWMVHGGGFYLAEKYTVAPERMPPDLHWFKWEAYFTWITGFLLLVVIYYFGASAFLIDRGKIALAPWQAIALSVGSLALGWVVYDQLCKRIGDRTAPLAASVFALIAAATFLYSAVFTDRAAFLHVGAFIGTIMAASVFFVIIPNQKVVVADLIAGRQPDPALGLAAKQRSLHNNYLTLPVVFMMISNHYPVVFGSPWSPFVALAIVVLGALIRHYFNQTNKGPADWSALAAIPAAIVVFLGIVAVTAYRPNAAAGAGPVAFSDVHPIVTQHCVQCHSARPSDPDFPEAPKGVALDTPEEIRAHARQIEQQAVLSDIMPLGNSTGMTDEERRLLGAWIGQGARLD